MKCKGCGYFKDDDCELAREGRIGEMEGDCLLRALLQAVGDTYMMLEDKDGRDDEGEGWKNVG